MIDKPAAEDASTSSSRVPTAKLRNDAKLVNLLRSCATTASDEDGWARLSTIGALMRAQQPDFDSRNWGYAKLSDLVRATELFEVETLPTGPVRVRKKK